VALHPERNEIILYGGAVHLSKDLLLRADGMPSFGAVVWLGANGWSAPIPGAWLRSLSQEHGVVRAEEAAWAAGLGSAQIGDLLGVLPVHSCLTADLLKEYRTLGGERLAMMHAVQQG
jgi:D-serine deaminase-like pyridoxal phosphate-dependent protein